MVHRLLSTIVFTAFAGLAGMSVAAQSVTTTTTTTYDTVTLLPKIVEVTSSDVVTSGTYRKTTTVYAHEVYSAMAASSTNMLSQVYSTLLEDGAGTDLACSRTSWQISGGRYVPAFVHEGCPSIGEEVHYQSFPNYDTYGRPTTIQTGDDLVITVGYGTNAAPFATGGPRMTGIRRDAGAGQVLDASFDYDTRGRPTEVTDPNGNNTSFVYDAMSRLIETHNDASELVSKTYYQYSRDTNGGDYAPGSPNAVSTHAYRSGVSGTATTSWTDGLGRAVGQSTYLNHYTDIASATTYDTAGRPSRGYRPFNTAGRANYPLYSPYGTYQATPASAAQSYWDAQSGIPTADAQKAYAETTYDTSPLQRVAFAREPGSTTYGVTYRYGVDRPDIKLPSSGSTGGWFARPEGAAPSMAYVETQDAGGRVNRTYADALGRERFIRAGVGSSVETLTEMVYDAADRLVEVRHPTYFYPRPGDGTLQQNRATSYVSDTRGHVREIRSPDTGYSSTATNGTRGLTEMKYDRMGRLRYSRDPEQTLVGEVAFWRYDRFGREERFGVGKPDPQDPDCAWATLSTGLNHTCDGAGTGYSFEFDWARIRRETVYDNGSPSYRLNIHTEAPFSVPSGFVAANAKDRVVAIAVQSDGKWQSEALTYDSEGRVTVKKVNTQGTVNPIETFTYTYNRLGEIQGTKVEVGSSGYQENVTLDWLGRVIYVYAGAGVAGTTISAPIQASYSYNAAGAVTSRLVNGVDAGADVLRSTPYTYDIKGRLTMIGDPMTIVDGLPTWTNATGLPPGGGEMYASPFTAEYFYTPGSLIDKVRQGSAYAVLGGTAQLDPQSRYPYWELNWIVYDALGRLNQAVYFNAGGSRGYVYDLHGLSYDANGNITQLYRRAPKASGYGNIDQLTYTYRPGKNQLMSVADAAQSSQWAGTNWDANQSVFNYRQNGAAYYHYQYLKQANNTTRSPYRYVYRMDEGGRPLYEYNRTWNESTGSYNYEYPYTRYGVGGWRISRKSGSNERRTVRDGSRSVGEFDISGALDQWNLPGGLGRIEASGSSYQLRFYFADHLGSVRAVMRENGSVAEARDYYLWGLEMPGRTYVSGSPTREGFTGHELDAETGMNYAGARYYMPALGRWTSVDPLAAQFPSDSPYSYALNNPLSLTDPNGMSPCDPAVDPNCPTQSEIDAQPERHRAWLVVPAAPVTFAGRVAAIASRVAGPIATIGGMLTMRGHGQDPYYVVRRNRGVESDDDDPDPYVVISKAVRPERAADILANGFTLGNHENEIPGEEVASYFAAPGNRHIAEEYSRSYSGPIIEVAMRRSVYESRFRRFEEGHSSTPVGVQLKIPASAFPVLNAQIRFPTPGK